MAVVSLTPRQWEAWVITLGHRFMPAVQRGVLAGAYRTIPLLQTRTDQAPPASPNGVTGAVNSGRFRNSWRAVQIPAGARVYNFQPYGPVIEEGRRAKGVNRAGLHNLEIWARRRLQLDRGAARSAAFAIAKTLAKRPLLARKVMSGAIDKMTELVLDEITHELEAELKRKP